MEPIPHLDVEALFGPETAARRQADAVLLAAAHDPGFLVLTGLPEALPLGPAARDELFRVFALPPQELRRLWRQASAPENPNVYRGFFPLEAGVIKEGFDIGPDRPVQAAERDALTEATPLPAEAVLPGWRAHMRRTFAALEAVGAALMRSLARGLGLAESHFDAAFEGGNSTLRLILYPPWPALAEEYDLPLRPLPTTGGPPQYAIGGEHVDSGFVTLLQQDHVGGLQAKLAGDRWADVPPKEGSLAVNFGKLLERWTAGRIRATEHRVLGNAVARRSIPFFYEPRVDARIAPLPLESGQAFEPFAYGDHLWQAMTRFAEFAQARRWR